MSEYRCLLNENYIYFIMNPSFHVLKCEFEAIKPPRIRMQHRHRHLGADWTAERAK